MPNRVARLLVLQHSATDAESLTNLLQRGGIRFEWERAATTAELQSCLRDRGWDVILSGVSGPKGESAIEEALGVARRLAPHVPFLVLAESIEVERAVALMRNGVADLITRDRLDQLTEMVCRALESPPGRTQPEAGGLLFQQIPAAVIALDSAGVVTAWNAAATTLLGWSEEEMLGRPYLERFPEEDRERFALGLQHLATTLPSKATFEERHRDGRPVHVQCQIAPLRLPDGSRGGTILVLRNVDVPSRETELPASGQPQYRELVETSHDLIWSVDTNGVITFMNEASRRISGRAPEEVIGTQFIDFVPPEDIHDHIASFMETLQSGEDTTFYESRIYHRDGSLMTVGTHCRVIRDEAGTPVGICGVSRDITAEKQAAQDLKAREALLSNAERIGNMGSWEIDLRTGGLQWSDQTLRIFGLTEQEFDGNFATFVQCIHPEDREHVQKSIREAEAGNGIINTEYRIIRADGEERILQGRGEVTYDADGNPIRRLGVTLDITEQRRSEQGLRMRDRAIQTVPYGILIKDPHQPDCPIIYANRGFETLTGYTAEEAIGRNCSFLQGPETSSASIERLNRAIRNREAATIELLNYRKDGSTFWNEVSVSPVFSEQGELTHFIVVQIDVTQRRAIAEQLRQVQKMEAIGRLAGGIAHDFNNLLTVINGYSEILLDTIDPEDPSRELLEEIRNAGERSTDLTRQLLAFSRKQVLTYEIFDLNTVVTGAERLLRRLIGEDIHLVTELNEALRPVRADPRQVEQVILNLAVNARDAMPTGGTLTIHTGLFTADDEFVRSRPPLTPGEYVVLSMTDTGRGMTSDVLARIFEPFFTTKKTGAGTGLGLSVVHGIVTQSGGHIEAESTPGEGATFRIYFPGVDHPVEESEEPPEVLPETDLPRGTETILLVEDEDGVRRFARQILTNCGYRVLSASHGAEALEVAAKCETPIQLLVTDVIMPGKGGREVAEALVATRPDLKVIFVSGYTDDAVVRHGVQESRVNFLHKPFTAADIARKVRSVLDATSASQ